MDIKQLIARLNELFKVSQTRALEATEMEERDRLRKEYLGMIRGQVKDALEQIEVVDGKEHEHGDCDSCYDHKH